MQRGMKNYLSAAAMTALMLGVATVRFVTSYGDVSSEKESLNQLVNEKSNVEDILAQLEAQKTDSQAYINDLDTKVSEIANKIYELQVQVDAKKKEVEATQEIIAKTDEEIASQYSAMKLRIQYMYENGNASFLTMIFDSKSIGDFLNQAEYISELTAYDRQMLEELQQKKNENEAAKASLTAQLADLETLQAAAEQERAATEQLIAVKNAEMESVNASIAEAENKMIDLEHDIVAQQALVAEMESIEKRRAEEEASRKAAEEASRKAAEEANKNNNSENATQSQKPVVNNGKYLWPLTSHQYISSYFSYRDNPFGGGNTEFHNGIDIPAPIGTPIMAVSGGQVAWSYRSASAGNWIGIDHGNGTYSVYMHMSARHVKEGDYVAAGDIIGLVGSTGRSTAPHLHLSIRLNGSYVDPLNYVSP